MRLCTMFQSTHPYGVRHHDTEDQRGVILFQSTHPYGVRRHRGSRR